MHKILYLFVILTYTSLFSETAWTAELPIPKAPSTGAKSFVIQDGCFFQGNCTMGDAATRPAEETTEEPSDTEMGVLKQA